MLSFFRIPSIKKMIAQLKREGRYDSKKVRSYRKDINKLHMIFGLFYVSAYLIYVQINDPEYNGLAIFQGYAYFLGPAILYLMGTHFYLRSQAPRCFYVVNFGEEEKALITKKKIQKYPKDNPKVDVNYTFVVGGKNFEGKAILNLSEIESINGQEFLNIKYIESDPEINGAFNQTVSEAYFCKK